ncbi:FkbM family methyltransferase [Brevundimonas bullata]|uniref:FkbM family methyltransferase n=1 Tax=Brevundimonas bullata TaxID=13160 RepID=UPI002FD8C2ED
MNLMIPFRQHLVRHVHANTRLPNEVRAARGAIDNYLDYIGAIRPSLDDEAAAAEERDTYEAERDIFEAWHSFYRPYGATYDALSDGVSRNTFVAIVAARMFWHKVKLRVHLDTSHKYPLVPTPADQEGLGGSMYDLNQQGYPVKIFTDPPSIRLSYFDLQYVYESGSRSIKAEPGDVVIDGGGYCGDTALYFSHLVGPEGRVFSFEFIPSNVELFQRNMRLNPTLADRVQLVEAPIWSFSGKELRFDVAGPASGLSVKDDAPAFVTKTIDDLVREEGVERVDFIKFDIEGAEVEGLRGAARTIAEHKPKLAICLYHANEHFHEIPLLIQGLNPNYRLYVRHLTPDLGETVLYAIDPDRP